MSTRDLDSNEWQAYCLELLTIHYGVRVQTFPDRVNGDGRLEAWVSDEVTAFQCYAPESPFQRQGPNRFTHRWAVGQVVAKEPRRHADFVSELGLAPRIVGAIECNSRNH